MGVVVFIILVIGTIGLLGTKPIQKLGHGTLILSGWFYKMTFAIIFVSIFTNYYGDGQTIQGDAYSFMHDSKVLHSYAQENPAGYLRLLFGLESSSDFSETSILNETNIWSYGDNGDLMNDNRLLIRINSVIHFFSFGYVYTHALLLAFLSYLGLLLLFAAFKSWVKNPFFFLCVLILFPSISFWGSGITKEALLIFSLGLFFYSILKVKHSLMIIRILLFVLSAAFLLLNKPHVGLVVLCLSPFFLIGRLTNWHPIVRWSIPFLTFLVAVLLTYTPEQFNLLAKISYKQRDLTNVGKGGVFFVTDSSFCAFDYSYLDHFEHPKEDWITVQQKTPGNYKLFGQYVFKPFEIQPSKKAYEVYLIQKPSNSYIDVTPINYQRSALITSIPEVAVNTMVRPYPWDPGNSLKIFPFLNNLLFLVFVAFVAFNQRKLNPKERYIRMYLMICSFCIILLIGWTTPILGAIVRYKVAVELLLIITLFISLKSLKKQAT